MSKLSDQLTVIRTLNDRDKAELERQTQIAVQKLQDGEIHEALLCIATLLRMSGAAHATNRIISMLAGVHSL